MYQVLVERKAQKQLNKIPEPYYTRLKKIILNLASNPRPAASKKLVNRAGFRIRQGNYRIIYDIDDHILKVFVIAAGHRKDVYE